ncbi:hypothetical protein BJG92_03560 [Arthrobacter sp. SO5]|nr:hypothetical protein [Arthrobacter sp. SO5]
MLLVAGIVIMLPVGVILATLSSWLFGHPLGEVQGVPMYVVIGISVLSMLAAYTAMLRLAYKFKPQDEG